ncbi:hypothetical protein PCL_05783 [Purpureocillium lilacinum]|uniref:Uncharacterized protein n=1 Tax=Purpureocillium lilacinum TaxID=33203 RepID=A0A2U3EKT6_PURLI|nr:hypothetical protein PCL_05783 [Purpureocillium lilacinum]
MAAAMEQTMPDRLPLIWQPDFWNWLQRGGFTCTPPWIQPQRRELHGSQIGYAPWCITRGTPDDPHPDGHTDTLAGSSTRSALLDALLPPPATGGIPGHPSSPQISLWARGQKGQDSEGEDPRAATRSERTLVNAVADDAAKTSPGTQSAVKLDVQPLHPFKLLTREDSGYNIPSGTTGSPTPWTRECLGHTATSSHGPL